jgi:hypothetical protein
MKVECRPCLLVTWGSVWLKPSCLGEALSETLPDVRDNDYLTNSGLIRLCRIETWNLGDPNSEVLWIFRLEQMQVERKQGEDSHG